jgi:hypothetical protein
MQNPRRGKAFSTPYAVPGTGPIDPFDLFCACFMGLMPDGTYRSAGLGEVAKQFGRSPNDIKQMLHDYGMDPETLRQVDFDVSLAKLDIQVAPEGMDRRELARGLFEEFCDQHPTLTCAPPEVRGNGARPEEHPHPAPAERTESAGGYDAGEEDEPPAPEEEAAGPGDADRGSELPMTEARAPEEPTAEEPILEEEPDDDAPLAAVDAGVTRGGPARAERPGRPVRQIRRSPTRRGR